MRDSQVLPDGTADVHTFIKSRIAADRRAASLERKALDRLAKQTGGYVKHGVVVPRSH
jgi:hypothetical protein